MDNEETQNPLAVTAVVVVALLIIGEYFQFQSITYGGIGLLFVALVSNRAAKLFTRIWMGFARAIGTFNSKVLLTIIFYLLLTPIAYLYRIIQGSPIKTVEKGKDQETYFIDCQKKFEKDDFESPW